MILNPILLAADAPQVAMLQPILMIGSIVAIFYFLLFRPAQQRQKKTAQMLAALKNGDKVITTGGIYGTIVGIEDESIQLRIADQVKVKVQRAAVMGLQPDNKES
jgi:preprotein translocase subunit YajC